MNYVKLRDIDKLYFGYEELSRVLGVKPGSARVIACRYVKNGFLLRLKRNMYILMDRWQALSPEDRFALANIVQVPSYISLMTAMGYYGITTQMQRDFIESVATRRTKEIKVENTLLNYTKIDKKLYFGFVRLKGYFIATPEKAFMDALYLKTLKRYAFDLSSIDFAKLDKRNLKTVSDKFPLSVKKELGKYGYFKAA